MKIVSLMSGGIDSTVMLYRFLAEGHEVVGMGFDYGQRHSRELDAARAICAQLGVPYGVVTIPALAGSELTDGAGGVVVPNRNMIMLSFATAKAIQEQADAVAIATHASDHALFPDCRPQFLDAACQAIMFASDKRVRLLRPFAHETKLWVIQVGMKLGVPFNQTWSCYVGGDEPCGVCLACRERTTNLLEAGAAA